MFESLIRLTEFMTSNGAVRILAKRLSPNDNSKNQVYLGGDFSALNIIPHSNIRTDHDNVAGSRRDRGKADISFSWIDPEGRYAAPFAQLILYPKYPEVRLSGFLKGCQNPPSKIMAVRDPGRYLFLGITNEGDILAYAVATNNPIAAELDKRTELESVGVFKTVPLGEKTTVSTRSQLLDTLRTIYQRHWIISKKLLADGTWTPYSARNGGGYTLEAELGIKPNGLSEPDFLGWEIKQHAVNNFKTFKPKGPVTLFTPEPTGGIYQNDGVHHFIKKFGYTDKSGKEDRMNFGGIYACNRSYHAQTGLKLVIQGYDAVTGKITDLDGGIVLLNNQDEVAASWNFSGILQHWNRKHAKAVYVPSLFRAPPPEYAYGPKILLCEGTDFLLFLKQLALGTVYYDPAIKIEGISGPNPKSKKRSQFRVSFDNLVSVYHKYEHVDL
jgi:hypothetical protein